MTTLPRTRQRLDASSRTRRAVSSWLCCLAVGVLALGCDSEGDADPGTDTGTATDATEDDVTTTGDTAEDVDVAVGEVAISDLFAVENPGNSLSYFVSWSTDRAVPTELAVDCGPDYQHTFTGSEAHDEHEVFVMGLWKDAECTLTPQPSATTSGESETTITDIGANMPGELAPLNVKVRDEAKMQPGWTLFSLASSEVSELFIVVAIDEMGRYRWHFSPGEGQSGAGTEVALVDGGIMLGSGAPHQQIVNWEGRTEWRLEQNAHHDMRPSPWNENHVLYLGFSDRGCDGTTEHGAFEMNMETREIVWDWSICEHYAGRVNYPNWSHLNTIEPVPGERAVLISSRNQDMVFKVDRDTGEVEWKLGLEGDFEMEPGTHFLRQHAPEVQSDGTILILDNGLAPEEAMNLEGWGPEMAREYTRAIEYELTFDADGNPDRANVVWEYADESIFAVNRSEADRLANGNTLIHYVWVQPDRTVVLREVDPEGNIVWDVETIPERSSYRSERIEPYLGHVLTP